MLSAAASGAGARQRLGWGVGAGAADVALGELGSRLAASMMAISGAWTCALGVVICLMGCQTPVTQSPRLPPPQPPAARLPRLVRPSFYVAVNQLGLRTCPGLDCRKISTLNLNAEVEKMGEVGNWTQIKVKKEGTIGYVSSRYLSSHPVEVAQHAKKKPRKAKPRTVTQPFEAAQESGQVGPQTQEPSSPLPRAM